MVNHRVVGPVEVVFTPPKCHAVLNITKRSYDHLVLLIASLWGGHREPIKGRELQQGKVGGIAGPFKVPGAQHGRALRHQGNRAEEFSDFPAC